MVVVGGGAPDVRASNRMVSFADPACPRALNARGAPTLVEAAKATKSNGANRMRPAYHRRHGRVRQTTPGPLDIPPTDSTLATRRQNRYAGPRMTRARPLPIALLGALAGLLLTIIELDVIEYAYEKAGIPHRLVFAVLVASLFGSLVNLPVTRFTRPDGTPGTVLAVNVGGAIIPTALSLYFLYVTHVWGVGLLATLIMAAIVHTVARPVPKLGIAMPAFLPAPIAAGIALVLAPQAAPGIAYAAGSLGTLIGADLTNLHRIRGMGAPVASIGGAGTFDGIFLVGLIAVLLA